MNATDDLPLSERVIPPLRPDITLEQLDDGGRLPYAAVDRRLGQRVRLDQRGAMLASGLDREWRAGELLVALDAAGLRLAPDLLVRFIRFLDAHYLLSGDRAESRIAALEASLDAPEPGAGVEYLPGTRHACVACGASCTGHDIGPVAPERVEDIRARMPGAPFLDRRTGDSETSGTYCAMKEDRCLFLQADQLCSIHAAHGASTKPNDCRIFPLAFTRTPRGVVAGVRLECRSYLASKRNGGALAERHEELAELVARLPSMVEIAPLVRISADLTVGWDEYAAMESSLLAALDVGPVAWEGLLALNKRAREEVQAVVSSDRRGWVFPPTVDADAGVGLERVIEALSDACGASARMNAAAGNSLRAARLEGVARASRRLLDGPVKAPALTADDQELLGDHVRQSVFLKDLVRGPHLRFGVGALNLQILLAFAGLDEADGDLNRALADTLKALRTGPVIGALQRLDGAVATHLHEQLEARVS